MNIQELREKIKELQERLNTREVYTILLILVVGFGSFGLGRLSKLEEVRVPIRIENAPAETASAAEAASPLTRGAPPTFSERWGGGVSPSVKGQLSNVNGPGTLVSGGQLVASKTGTKYHFPWCSGAARISEANKVWFNSVEEARKAGYTPASNCKGLK